MDHRRPKHFRILLSEGSLYVTGKGDVIIEEPLKRSRSLFVHSDEMIEVDFAEDAPPCPPCNPDEEDEVFWEVFERDSDKILFLRICWRVSCARTVKWAIYDVE